MHTIFPDQVALHAANARSSYTYAEIRCKELVSVHSKAGDDLHLVDHPQHNVWVEAEQQQQHY